MGRRLAGRLGLAGTGSPPSGGPPSGPCGGLGPPPPFPPPPPGGPPSPPYGLHSDGWESSPLSVRLKALLKLSASFVSTWELVWVTMVGGSYFWGYRAVQADLGGTGGLWAVVGLFLICSSRAF